MKLAFEELLRYTNEEREKWRDWMRSHPGAVDAPVRPDAPEGTVGKLLDHIFLVERQHLQRLTDQPPARSTGLTGNNAAPLFDYGASVRRELESYVRGLDDEAADQVCTVELRGRQWTITPRKLLFTILVHEIRHWAQIALAVRLAGFAPPGDHDLFYSRALR